MKGDLMYSILDFLEDRAVSVIDSVEVILEAGYGAGLGKLMYLSDKKASKREGFKIERERKRRLQKYIYELKKDGLISNDIEGKLSLSTRGLNKLRALKENRSINKSIYKKEKNDRVTIVSYDIPEIFKRERNILRDLLKYLGFNLVHKSVWVGKARVSEQFIKDMEKLKILDYIEILEVTKTGTLKSIID